MEEAERVWQELLSILEVEISTLGFDVWIRPLRLIGIVDGKLRICADTAVIRDEVAARHMPLFKKALRRIDGAPAEVELVTIDDIAGEIAEPPSSVEEVEKEKEKVEPNTLIPKYNFERFIVGDSNRVAYAAARAVADEPGHVYNPLFIYGGVGLGKTHLMHAIGNAVRMSMKDLKVLYVSSETFLNEFIASIRNDKGGNGQSFRDKYRNVDLLMIDDVQFISKKPSTQEEIFHTFEALKSANKQMVFASDRSPQDISDLDDRVRSRFSSSLIVDIQPPSYELRMAIIQAKAEEEKLNIPKNVVEFIAEHVSSNVREIEGVITKVSFLAKLTERKIDLDVCREAFNDYKVQVFDEISTDEIIDCTCRYFGVSKDDVIGKRKSSEIVEPRQIAMYLINELLNLPLKKIGDIFSGREHTTAMHARDKISAEMISNPRIRTAVNDIKAMVLRK